MEAHELMIGNTIDKGTIVNMLESGVHVGYGKCYTYDEISPIPLTEEWLLRFGFKKGVKGWFKTMERNLKFNLYTYNRDCYKSVHQLQNLYFALTGTHLILNK